LSILDRVFYVNLFLSADFFNIDLYKELCYYTIYMLLWEGCEMIYDAEKNAVLITVDELCSAAYGFSDLGAGGGYAVCERVSAGGMDYIISGGVELEAPNGAGLYTLYAEGNKRVQNMRLGFSARLCAVSLGLTK
jgi:hypothetical protein